MPDLTLVKDEGKLGLAFVMSTQPPGIKITRVAPGSAADRGGLTSGMLITAVEGLSVAGLDKPGVGAMFAAAGNRVIVTCDEEGASTLPSTSESVVYGTLLQDVPGPAMLENFAELSEEEAKQQLMFAIQHGIDANGDGLVSAEEMAQFLERSTNLGGSYAAVAGIDTDTGNVDSTTPPASFNTPIQPDESSREKIKGEIYTAQHLSDAGIITYTSNGSGPHNTSMVYEETNTYEQVTETKSSIVYQCLSADTIEDGYHRADVHEEAAKQQKRDLDSASESSAGEAAIYDASDDYDDDDDDTTSLLRTTDVSMQSHSRWSSGSRSEPRNSRTKTSSSKPVLTTPNSSNINPGDDGIITVKECAVSKEEQDAEIRDAASEDSRKSGNSDSDSIASTRKPRMTEFGTSLINMIDGNRGSVSLADKRREQEEAEATNEAEEDESADDTQVLTGVVELRGTDPVELINDPLRANGMPVTGVQGLSYDVYAGDALEINVDMFEVLCKEAIAHQDTGEFDSAIKLYNDALELEQIPYGFVAFVYSSLGTCHSMLRKHGLALMYQRWYCSIATQVGDMPMRLLALANVGIAHYALTEFSRAVNAHQKSLELAVELGSTLGEMRAFANLGNCFAAMGNFREAVLLHEKQLELANSLGDPEAKKRAAFNLENDHNSLRNYTSANKYREIKRFRSDPEDPEQVLNAGFGDTLGRVVHSGWLVKHLGGEFNGPVKYSSTRRWVLLTEKLFSYYKDTKTGRRADRYIRVGDITGVNRCNDNNLDPLITLPHAKRPPNPSHTFRIATVERAYFMTAESEEDCQHWIEKLYGITAARNKFGTLRKGNALSGRRRNTTTFLMNSINSEADHRNLESRAENNPLRHDLTIVNPLFQRDSQYEPSETDAESVGSRLSAFGTAAGVMKAWADQQTKRRQDTSRLASSPMLVKLLGSVVTDNRGMVPIQTLKKEYDALKEKPRKLYHTQQLQLGMQEDYITVSVGGEVKLTHPLKTVVGVESFGETLALVVRDPTDDKPSSKRTYFYVCATERYGSELFDMISEDFGDFLDENPQSELQYNVNHDEDATVDAIESSDLVNIKSSSTIDSYELRSEPRPVSRVGHGLIMQETSVDFAMIKEVQEEVLLARGGRTIEMEMPLGSALTSVHGYSQADENSAESKPSRDHQNVTVKNNKRDGVQKPSASSATHSGSEDGDMFGYSQVDESNAESRPSNDHENITVKNNKSDSEQEASAGSATHSDSEDGDMYAPVDAKLGSRVSNEEISNKGDNMYTEVDEHSGTSAYAQPVTLAEQVQSDTIVSTTTPGNIIYTATNDEQSKDEVPEISTIYAQPKKPATEAISLNLVRGPSGLGMALVGASKSPATGVFISKVKPGGVAEAAGAEVGMRLIEVNDVSVRSSLKGEVTDLITAQPQIRITVLRDLTAFEAVYASKKVPVKLSADTTSASERQTDTSLAVEEDNDEKLIRRRNTMLALAARMDEQEATSSTSDVGPAKLDATSDLQFTAYLVKEIELTPHLPGGPTVHEIDEAHACAWKQPRSSTYSTEPVVITISNKFLKVVEPGELLGTSLSNIDLSLLIKSSRYEGPYSFVTLTVAGPTEESLLHDETFKLVVFQFTSAIDADAFHFHMDANVIQANKRAGTSKLTYGKLFSDAGISTNGDTEQIVSFSDPAVPLNLPSNAIVVEVSKGPSGYGISIVNSNDGRGNRLKQVKVGSPAGLTGKMSPGMVILTVNGIDCQKLTKLECVALIQASSTVKLGLLPNADTHIDLGIDHPNEPPEPVYGPATSLPNDVSPEKYGEVTEFTKTVDVEPDGPLRHIVSPVPLDEYASGVCSAPTCTNTENLEPDMDNPPDAYCQACWDSWDQG